MIPWRDVYNIAITCSDESSVKWGFVFAEIIIGPVSFSSMFVIF